MPSLFGCFLGNNEIDIHRISNMIILIRKTSDIMSDTLKEIESRMQQVKEELCTFFLIIFIIVMKVKDVYVAVCEL